MQCLKSYVVSFQFKKENYTSSPHPNKAKCIVEATLGKGLQKKKHPGELNIGINMSPLKTA